MKKCSSLVWRFFDRIENESKRCLAVLCKLCDTQYKFFGNTTNLRAHMLNKHPLQWELAQNGTLDESSFRVEDDDNDTNQSTTSPKRRKYSRAYNKDKNVRYSVSVDKPRISSGGAIPKIEIQRIDVLENSEAEHDTEETEATYNLVRQLHNNSGLPVSDEEWLEDEFEPTYEPKRKKMTYRKIKREVMTPPRRPSYVRVVKNEPKPTPIVIDNYKDEYSVFGEYVANKLRKFKAPRTRGNLQQLITTILWQAEYGAYDNADAVKRLLMYSVQAQDGDQPVHQEFETQVQTEEVVEHREDDHNESIVG